MSAADKINPKGIIFDFDYTLVDTGSTLTRAYDMIFSEISTKFGVRKTKLFHEYELVCSEKIASNEVYDHASWISEITKRASIKLTDRESDSYKRSFYSYVIDNPIFEEDTTKILNAFKTKGKKLALLSERDFVDGLKTKRIDRTKLGGYFDIIVIAGETIPFRKVFDGPKAFLETAKLLDLHPRNIVMVGDSLDLDIQNAKEAGMKAILFDRYRKSKKHSRYRPDFIAHDLNELEGIIT